MPRQITSFEFKLIGFLTLKQFIYLVVFIPLGFIVFKLISIPVLNILFALAIGGIGVAFAFIPVNDRPLDVWVKNFFKRITSPTQYVYHKKNPPIYFLKNLFFITDPHRVMTHIESQEKLAVYLANNKPQVKDTAAKKKNIISLFQKPSASLKPQAKSISTTGITSAAADKPAPAGQAEKAQPPSTVVRKPFFSGVVKNHRLIPLPGILIYVKNDNGGVIRLLKTNPHGVFATFNPLTPKEYLFEFKDPKNTYFFDTMSLKLEEANPKPLEFFSKELI